jgi:SOS-response transcriptional repressor LexA
MNAVALTTRQSEILEYILWHIEEHFRPPTVRQIGQRFGITSPNGVMCHLNALESKGHIARDDFEARGIRPLGVKFRRVLLDVEMPAGNDSAAHSEPMPVKEPPSEKPPHRITSSLRRRTVKAQAARQAKALGDKLTIAVACTEDSPPIQPAIELVQKPKPPAESRRPDAELLTEELDLWRSGRTAAKQTAIFKVMRRLKIGAAAAKELCPVVPAASRNLSRCGDWPRIGPAVSILSP